MKNASRFPNDDTLIQTLKQEKNKQGKLAKQV